MNRTPLFAAICLACLLLPLACKNDKPDTSAALVSASWKNLDNTVSMRLVAEPDRLNPLLTTAAHARPVHEQIFLSLLHFDPATFELKPLLAKSKPAVAATTDGQTVTFELHDEAVWDNGQPVTGHDFVFTIKTIFNPKVQTQPFRPYFEFLQDVQVDPQNPKRFTAICNKKYLLIEPVLGTVPILPEYHFDPQGLMRNFTLPQLLNPESNQKLAAGNAQIDAFAEAFGSDRFSREPEGVIGQGPYKLVEWTTGQRVVLQKKENWWGDALADRYPGLQAYPEELIFIPMADAVSYVTGLRDEQFDAGAAIDTKDFVKLKEDADFQKDFQTLEAPQFAYYYIGLNTRRPLLSDKAVRRAIAHLVNVPNIISNLFDNFATPVAGPVPSIQPFFNKNLQPIGFDPAKATALLTEAGWTDKDNDGLLDKVINGKKTPFQITFSIPANRAVSQNVALILQEEARKVGLGIEILTKEGNAISQDMKSQEFDMIIAGTSSDPGPWDPKQTWHTDSARPGGSNYSGFGNAASDALIDQIRTSLDEKERQELYYQFQQMVYDEQPVVFLFTPVERFAIHRRFQGNVSSVRPGFFPNTFKLVTANSN